MPREARPTVPLVHIASLVCAALVILLGVGTVVSWQLLDGAPDPFSNRLIDGLVAAAFVICGTALLLVKGGWLRAAAGMGGLVTVLCLLIFADDVMKLDLGINPAALESFASARSIAFVSIAPTTLIAFGLAGASLIALGLGRRQAFLAALLGTLVGTLGLTAVVNRGVAELPLEWLSYFQTQPLTALGLLVLGIALATAALGRIDPRPAPADWAVPLAIGTTTLLVGLMVWHGLRLNELRQLEQSLERRTEVLTVSITNNLRLVADYLAGYPYEPAAPAGTTDSTTFIRPTRVSFPGLSDTGWIEVADPSDPSMADRFAQIPQLRFLEGRYDTLFEAEGPIVSGPTTLEGGEIAFRIVMRRDLDEQSRAFLSGMIAASTIFATVPQLGGSAVDVVVLSDEEPVFVHGDIDPGDPPPWGRTVGLALPGPAAWQLFVSPRVGLLDAGRSAIPELVLGASLLIAVLLTALARTAAQARHRAHELEQAAQGPFAPAGGPGFEHLTATIGNEIRNPLAVILNVIELRQIKTHGEREVDSAHLNAVLRRQSNRILDVMNAMIDLTGGARSAGLPDLKEIDLAALVRDVVGSASMGDYASPVTLTCEQDEIIVQADPDRLARSLRNVLSYARRHTPAGTSVDVRVERPADGEACVSIQDHGPALPPGDENKLFTPSVERHASSPRTIDGTLLLTAAKRIVELHDGRITASSKPDGGVEFRILLPVR